MANRYDRGWRAGRRYGREHGRGPAPRRAAQVRGGYDREWTDAVAYGREPGLSMAPPATFSPFGWDPMMRWAGWDPLMGFVPYQDSPRQWSYGLADDYRRYEHDDHRGNTTGGYGRDYHGIPRRPGPRR